MTWSPFPFTPHRTVIRATDALELWLDTLPHPFDVHEAHDEPCDEDGGPWDKAAELVSSAPRWDAWWYVYPTPLVGDVRIGITARAADRLAHRPYPTATLSFTPATRGLRNAPTTERTYEAATITPASWGAVWAAFLAARGIRA